MQVCAYLGDRLGTGYGLDNIFFDSPTMVKEAMKLPKYSIVHYDEGRESLATTKTASQIQKDILDYFAECGQLNHIFVIVLPDFFELKENMAVPRSIALINTYLHKEKKFVDIYDEGELLPVVDFKRGYFQFFSDKRKKNLYDISRAKNRKSYGLVPCNFYGRFTNNYPIDRQAYEGKKLDALARYKKDEKKEATRKSDIFRDYLIYRLRKAGYTHLQISRYLLKNFFYEISESHCSTLARRYPEQMSTMRHISRVVDETPAPLAREGKSTIPLIL